jgi:hypothetical protein
MQTIQAPVFNFAAIYRVKSLPFMHAKIRLLLNYFHTVMKKMPKGSITIERRALAEEHHVNFYESDAKLCPLTIETKLLIEDAEGAIQVRLLASGYLSSSHSSFVLMWIFAFFFFFFFCTGRFREQVRWWWSIWPRTPSRGDSVCS